MKRTLFAAAWLLYPAAALKAQFHVGSVGVYVAAGTTLAIDRLTLVPSADLTITSTSLERDLTPIPGSPSSISRVYRFSSSVTFSGVAGIYYLPEELNGNTEEDLEIAYSAGTGYIVTSGSTVDVADHYVFNDLSGVALLQITATGQGGSLPVTLSEFEVYRGESIAGSHTACLSWRTTMETNSDRFEIERSHDAISWKKVGELAAHSESASPVSYSFNDVIPFYIVSPNMRTAYYRLKMVDLDARFSYSPIRSLDISMEGRTVLYPNPAREKVMVSGAAGQPIEALQLRNLQGQVLIEMDKSDWNANVSSNGLYIGHLPTGVYLLRVVCAEGVEDILKIVKQ